MRRKRWEKQYNKVTIDEIATVGQIVSQKKWPKENHNGEKFVNVFCGRLSKFDDSQRKLILKLTQKFLLIPVANFCKEFIDLFRQWIFSIKPSRKRIIICPMLAPDDFNKNKSSTTLWYIIHSLLRDDIAEAANTCRVSYRGSSSGLNYSSGSDDILVLIDDFVGTGYKAYKAMSYLVSNGWNISNIYLLSIVMMDYGQKYLQSEHYNSFTLHLCSKGITGASATEQEDLDLMENIEKELGVSEKFRFGYQKSEALVSTINTPNNTFPFYWWKNENYSKPPFTRGGTR